ncbi:hypothetical protein BJ978_000767 [Agromyces terreus]|uniref:IPT/TIG domain-containing protein n=1 Tax=Agromyces terreus TaxID=424795 RepID=A0A9X2KB86_9MICO|nr:amidase domain-containing protein [Agromyces terreus]MCP2370091.1 hypothetical protein [Agromyces terreus]
MLETTAVETTAIETTAVESTAVASTAVESAVVSQTESTAPGADAADAEWTEAVVPAASAGPEADAARTIDSAPRGSQPRHRAERVRNRRAAAGKPAGKFGGKAAGSAVRRTAALGSAAAFLGLSAFGAIIPSDANADETSAHGDPAELDAASRDAISAATSAAAEYDSIAPAVETAAEPAITSRLSTAAAPFTGGTQVTVKGRSLDEVAAVTVGSTPATIIAADETEITFQVPAVTEASAGAAVDVTMTAADGDPVEVVTTEAPASTVASLISSSVSDDGEAGATAAVAEKPAEPLTFTYTSDPRIDAQVQYVLAYWSNYNSAQYPVFSGVDCANFASQSLIARGWAMDGGWFYDAGTGTMSSSWSSSTALRDYLLGQPARATYLDDSQRGQVKVGDIAQFDWDDSGDRDHTAVVTRVEHTASGSKVWVGGHTKDIDYWDVDEALASGGGSVSYFSIH